MFLSALKQTWQLARDEKLFTGIYIAGTALAVASVTIFAIIYYVKVAPVYPEFNRDRSYYMATCEIRFHESSGMNQYAFGTTSVENYFRKVKNAELISAKACSWGNERMQSDDDKEYEARHIKSDPEFFKLYNYEFIDGRPFNSDEFKSGAKVAVVSDKMAQRLFGTTENLIGRETYIEFRPYRIVGIFREGSAVAHESYANAITPYTATERYTDYDGMYGDLDITFVTDNPEGLREEIEMIQKRFNNSNDHYILNIYDQPTSHLESVFRENPTEVFSWKDIVKHNLLILIVLLLVPALNISGLISSRMQSRLPEMGVRKAFGATARRLLGRVMTENLMLTLAGGLLGLVVTWLIIYLGANWIFFMISSAGRLQNFEVSLNSDMLFAPAIFGFAFLTCLVLNVISGLIPAWRSLRKPIVNSLKQA